MEQTEFNPTIEVVVSLRHYAIAVSENWSSMKASGTILTNDMKRATKMVNTYSSEVTKQQWLSTLIDFNASKLQLQQIMARVVSKIKGKTTEGLTEGWNEHPMYVSKIEASYKKLKELGLKALPENRKREWEELWSDILNAHTKMGDEAKAIGLQLGLMEQCNPNEIDELSDAILRHIPIHYSKDEAKKYTNEYMAAYEQLKKEASQKKTLWDRFLDILAGGSQQTPAQRVMMQRWVDGEKGDAH